jgi:hypothetical protein
MCSGPTVLLLDCSSVNVNVPSAYVDEYVTIGVPGVLYHRANWVKSTPLASAMADKKSSHVTADPS